MTPRFRAIRFRPDEQDPAFKKHIFYDGMSRFIKSLPVAIVISSSFAILLFLTLSKLWSGEWFLLPKDPEESALEILRIVLTALGGFGAIGYLVIRYRERSSAERADVRSDQDRKNQELLTAVKMLGDAAPSTRIAGVYSLVDVADSTQGAMAQRVVNILCGYLRTTRESDGSVESTILKVISEKYKRSDDNLNAPKNDWRNCSIDLHGAVLTEELRFNKCQFDASVDLRDISSEKEIYFSECEFIEPLNLSGIMVWIVNFKRVAFAKDVILDRGVFEHIGFDDVIFGGSLTILRRKSDRLASGSISFLRTYFLNTLYLATEHVDEEHLLCFFSESKIVTGVDYFISDGKLQPGRLPGGLSVSRTPITSADVDLSEKYFSALERSV